MEIKGFTVVIYLIFKLFLGSSWLFFLVHGLKIFIEDVYEISMEKIYGKYHIGCQFFQADFWSQFKNFPQTL